MVRHIRIPLLIDVMLTRDPDDIRELAQHDGLDRGFDGRGPLVNRLLSARVRRGLRLGGAPLPSARMRDDAARITRQDALKQLFVPGNWDPAIVIALASYVRGEEGRHVGQLAQDAVGRVFRPEFRAGHDSWEAAQVIGDHIAPGRPLRRFLRVLTGALSRAQVALGRTSDNDPAAVHGLGVAIHNLVVSLEKMRAAWADTDLRARLNPTEAAHRSITAPRNVMRAGAAHTDVIGGRLRPGTLVAMQTREAASATMDTRLAFLGEAWSHCPAEAWVMGLLAEVWRQAAESAA